MAALSSKDKLKLRLSAKRLEAWKEQRNRSVVGHVAVKGDTFTAIARGQDKPVLSYPDKDVIVCAEGHTRSMSEKLGRHGNAIAARIHTLVRGDKETGEVTSQVVHWCEETGKTDFVPDPQWRKDGPKTVRVRRHKQKAFANAQAASLSVQIVRIVSHN